MSPATARILVVDDRPANLLAMEAVLEPLGQRIVRAESGAEALAHLRDDDYAVVVLDVQMPEMDGFETAAQIRRGERNSDVPIVFVSAIHSEESYALRGYAAGAIDYLAKPFNPDVVRSKIAVLVELYQQRTALAEQASQRHEHERAELLVQAHDARLEVEALVGDLRRHEAQLQLIIDAVPALISYVDAEERYRLVNRAYESWFGRPAAEIVGHHLREVVGDAAYAEMRPRVAAALAGQAVTYEAELPYREGGVRWVQAACVPDVAPDGRVRGYVALVQDTTARRRHERELERALAATRASEQVAHRERARAEADSRQKDDFLATVSHELRTPLTAIVGWAHLLITSAMREEQRAHALEAIARNARAQAQIVDDLLDYSQITAGTLRVALAPIRAAEAIEAALETVRPTADAKGVHVYTALDGELVAHADARRLQQIAWNLLSNAVKFTPRGGRIDVTLRGVDGELVELLVEDSGEGLDAAFLPHVFDRFRQADSSVTRRHGGLGLGLALVRQLVEQHGGTVEARSLGVGCGATFAVRIPAAPRG